MRLDDTGGGDLITLWKTFEVTNGFSGSLKLSVTSCPACIGHWIERAQSPTWQVPIKDLSQFAADFLAWWRSLQPGWHVVCGASALARTSGDLEPIQRPGPNGLVSILVALFFWHFASGRTKSSESVWLNGGKEVWEDAVDDVHWIFEGLVKEAEQRWSFSCSLLLYSYLVMFLYHCFPIPLPGFRLQNCSMSILASPVPPLLLFLFLLHYFAIFVCFNCLQHVVMWPCILCFINIPVM